MKNKFSIFLSDTRWECQQEAPCKRKNCEMKRTRPLRRWREKSARNKPDVTARFYVLYSTTLKFHLLSSPLLTNGRFLRGEAALNTQRAGKIPWIAVILSAMDEGFQGQHDQKRRTGQRWLKGVRVFRGNGRGGPEKREMSQMSQKTRV